jgi:DNA polymerase-3 subunit delta
VSVHLVLGEPVLVREHVERLVHGVLGDARPPLTYAVFGADDGAPGAIELAMTVPMLGKMRVVCIRGIESANAQLLHDLAAYVDAPAQSTLLVISGTSLPSAAGAMSAGKKLEAIVKKNGEASRLKSEDVDALRFVTDAAKKRGIAIEPAAARALVQALGDALGPLERELEKVALYVGPDAKVDVAAVEECVRPIRETDAFELARAIVRRDLDRALAITDRLFTADAHAGHGIIGPLTWNVRSLLVLQDCLRTGKNPFDEGVRMRSADIGAARDLVKKHPLDGERLLNRLATAYRDMHEKKADERDQFEVLVIDLIGA